MVGKSAAVAIQEIEQDAQRRIAAIQTAEREAAAVVAANRLSEQQRAEIAERERIKTDSANTWIDEHVPELQAQFRQLSERVIALRKNYDGLDNLLAHVQGEHSAIYSELSALTETIAKRRVELPDIDGGLVDVEFVVSDAVGAVVERSFALAASELVKGIRKGRLPLLPSIRSDDLFQASRYADEIIRKRDRQRQRHGTN